MSLDKESLDTIKVTAVITFVVVVLCMASWVFGSAMEARAYNNVTGKHVSTWDAMWIELRVQESPK